MGWNYLSIPKHERCSRWSLGMDKLFKFFTEIPSRLRSLRFNTLDLMHSHDDVIKWEHFPRYWPIVRGIHRSPVNSPHKGQWCGALMFPLIARQWFETPLCSLWRHCNVLSSPCIPWLDENQRCFACTLSIYVLMFALQRNIPFPKQMFWCNIYEEKWHFHHLLTWIFVYICIYSVNEKGSWMVFKDNRHWFWHWRPALS